MADDENAVDLDDDGEDLEEAPEELDDEELVDEAVDVDDVEDIDEEDDDFVADVVAPAPPPPPPAKPRKKGEDDDEEEEDDDDDTDDDVEADLDAILKDRIAAQPDEDDDEDEETPEPDDRGDGAGRIQPKRPGEFVCQSCFLVKHPSQLADADHMLCADCV
jgi:Domain of unknown function (DUF4193)